MGRKLNLLTVQNTLREKGFSIISPFEFSQIFKVSDISAQKFLERYAKKGFFEKPRKGYYVVNTERHRLYYIANRIYSPSYVSFDTALSYYGLIPEITYAVSSATTKPTREFNFGEVVLSYSKIKREAFSGYLPMQIDGIVVFFAEKEKALCDYLYFVSLGKRSLNDRLNLSKINKKKLIGYSKLFKRKALDRIINDII